MRIEVAGENALILYVGTHGEQGVAHRVEQVTRLLKESMGDLLIDLVPSYASVLIIFDLFRCDHLKVRQAIRNIEPQLTNEASENGRIVTLPVYYAAEVGADLEDLARNAGLTTDEVIHLHQATDYRVYAIGFAPGFAYLGDVDERIAAPRLSTPRQRVPRGAVAIADRQTAVYPAVSPGGWNLIGRCPQRMFNPDLDPSMPVQVGDKVRFESITRDDYLSLGGSLDD
ncbi:5-oxoprolinase subunit PxpB [Marinomonas balearica]|uniref:KipI family sensor histidine kinase inhibitor n=1 Tax=Marinomonas balearica TaxID=491947 RepID=A0A4R6M7F3_9GAMM|nr:5-oxoprolinase subunit PxpB [Marinomonas balearica]TDO97348.1 KipI family sensor histidine kinase inhibitor [Marinomonas balearica]